MAKIYFICGFIGSGKTTFSKKLAKQQSAFRFSMDEWMIPLYGQHMERELFDSRIATLQELFRESALQMLELGISVIFDFGFWKREDRQLSAEWAKTNGLDFEIIYLDTSYKECRKRALKRNAIADDKSYEMTPEMLSLFWSWFEIPRNEKITKVHIKSVDDQN